MIQLADCRAVQARRGDKSADHAKRGGWRMVRARVRRAARKLVLVPVHGAARGMFLVPSGRLGQVSGSPAAPPKGAGLMQDALNWVLWGGLILCAVAAAGGAGTIRTDPPVAAGQVDTVERVVVEDADPVPGGTAYLTTIDIRNSSPHGVTTSQAFLLLTVIRQAGGWLVDDSRVVG